MAKVKATTKQGERTLGRVYDFIVEYMTANLYAPGVREIGDGVGLALSLIHISEPTRR